MNQKKSVSFSTILLLGLIISTVIVFAVLIFLSYENMVDSSFADSRVSVEDKCLSLAESANVIIDGETPFFFDQDNYKTKIITNLIDSNVKDTNSAAYICDNLNTIKYSKNAFDGFNVRTTDAQNYGISSDFISVDESRSIIYSICRVEKSNVYIAYAEVYDRSTALIDFTSIILYPALIAIVVAIALFVLAIQLTLTPVREMTRVFSKVSEGDYSVRVNEKFTDNGDYHFTTASGDIVKMATVVNDMLLKLENQEKDRQIFISSVAHDIRTPITSINGFVTAIMDGTIPPENQEHYLKIIKQELNRIRTLVVTMTEASSLSHVDPDIMERFNVMEMISDIVENLQPQFGDKKISCSTRLDSNAKFCYGEAQQLCRVVMNILTNAIKFTPENGSILVETHAEPENNRVMISVEDSGIGVPQEKRSRVFESFYKVDTSRTHEGFGLGLYICKQILQGHGQTIYLDEGKELGGAKFVFYFPTPPEGK